MDPTASWDMMLSAYKESNWEEALEYAEALLGWLRQGGFPPQTSVGSSNGTVLIQFENDAVNRSTADAVARAIALEAARKAGSDVA